MFFAHYIVCLTLSAFTSRTRVRNENFSFIGIKELAELNQLSETYLSKIFTKLRKSGIVRSSQGAKGGYELAKKAENISFWDIVEAVEGSSYMFQCAEIRQANILSDETDASHCDKPCLSDILPPPNA